MELPEVVVVYPPGKKLAIEETIKKSLVNVRSYS